MINRLASQPAALSHQFDDEHCIWFDVRDAQVGTYAWLGLRIKGDECQIHLEVEKWSHSTLKKLEQDWSDVLVFCRDRGVDLINITTYPGNDLLGRFARHFGFSEFTTISVSTMEVSKNG